MPDEDLPELFASADAASLSAQHRYMRLTAAQLALLVTAALAGIITLKAQGTDWAKIGAAGALFAAAIAKTAVITTKSERIWYEGRAAAESAKTLGWRYAVGAEPFNLGLTTPEADKLMLTRLHEVLQTVRTGTFVPLAERGDQITPRMRALRAKPLAERKAAYADGRVENQRRWYARKAASNERRSRWWNTALLSFQVIAGVAAIVKSTGRIAIDFSSLGAALVGSATAWTQTKQHLNIASAYAIAARELADIKVLMDEPRTEEEWAKFAEHAEDAISREHTLWRASRSG